jgi:hypothetical protein
LDAGRKRLEDDKAQKNCWNCRGISKLNDSRISNPEIKNLKLDSWPRRRGVPGGRISLLSAPPSRRGGHADQENATLPQFGVSGGGQSHVQAQELLFRKMSRTRKNL